MTDLWLILRTSSRHTIALTECLRREGYEAWTPVVTFLKRTPRRRETRQVELPMLPSFAFAKAHHAQSLLELAEAFSKPCPDFSIFRHMNEVRLVRDDELSALRMIEERKRRDVESLKPRQIRFKAGQSIRLVQGSFAGLDGVVENDDGRFAMVSFGNTKVKISTFLLSNDNIQEPQRA